MKKVELSLTELALIEMALTKLIESSLTDSAKGEAETLLNKLLHIPSL